MNAECIQHEMVREQHVDVGQGANKALIAALKVFGDSTRNPVHLSPPLHVVLDGNGRDLYGMESRRGVVTRLLPINKIPNGTNVLATLNHRFDNTHIGVDDALTTYTLHGDD